MLINFCSKCKCGCMKAVNKHQWLRTNVVLTAEERIACWRSQRPFIYIVMLMAHLKGFLTSFTHEVHFACHSGSYSACESFSLLKSNSGGINSPLESGQQGHCPTVIAASKGSSDPLKHTHTHTHTHRHTKNYIKWQQSCLDCKDECCIEYGGSRHSVLVKPSQKKKKRVINWLSLNNNLHIMFCFSEIIWQWCWLIDAGGCRYWWTKPQKD